MIKHMLSAALVCLALPVFAGPSINVGSLNEYIQGSKNTLAKRITNTGDATSFVRVTVDEIVFSTEGYKEIALDSSALMQGKGTGLISSPARMIIPAKGMQTNRLVFTGSRSDERYYRVRYIPVVPEKNDDFGLNNEEQKGYQQEVSAGISVLTGFGTIVTVLPENARFDTKIRNVSGRLNITNNGNASIVISGLRECEKGLKNCSSALSQQLRPGMQMEKIAGGSRNWYYTLTEGTQLRDMMPDK